MVQLDECDVETENGLLFKGTKSTKTRRFGWVSSDGLQSCASPSGAVALTKHLGGETGGADGGAGGGKVGSQRGGEVMNRNGCDWLVSVIGTHGHTQTLLSHLSL